MSATHTKDGWPTPTYLASRTVDTPYRAQDWIRDARDCVLRWREGRVKGYWERGDRHRLQYVLPHCTGEALLDCTAALWALS